MKKSYLFLAATVLLSFASCSDNTYLGDQEEGSTGSGGISFGSLTPTLTRATGAEAASLLNKKFVVSGFKGNGTTMSTVFDNYIVNWTENTAGKTASNTSDWEYVGIDAAAPSTITGKQTIKYWDYSASQYDFAAYSLGTNTSFTEEGEPSAGYIKVTSIGKADTYAGPTYTLKGSAVDLAKCYISDMVTVNKADYNKEVQLSFRSLGTKIRVGFYETIPGYSVKDVKFYTDNATSIATGASATSATLFMPSSEAIGFGSAGTYTVTFTNKVAQVAFAKDASASPVTLQTFGDLTYKAKEHNEKTAGNIYLGRSSNNVSFAGTEYNTVLPLSKTATGDVLELRVDYTLVPIDGADETITIHGAKAFVPATYTKWLPNYAYTYIFKISDNTNGWTDPSGTDPAGLYPITFDAVTLDQINTDNEQTTITTVAAPSITTYQKGHLYNDADEYLASKGAIYVRVMDNGANPVAAKTDLNSKGKLYTVTTTDAAISEATVMDALNIVEIGTTGRNGITLTQVTPTFPTTIVGPDGNNIDVDENSVAQFTPSATTIYAYVYDYTTGSPTAGNVYTAVQLTGDTAPTDFTTKYFKKNLDGTYTPCDAGDYTKNNYYYVHYTDLNRTYSVKIIKVV